MAKSHRAGAAEETAMEPAEVASISPAPALTLTNDVAKAMVETALIESENENSILDFFSDLFGFGSEEAEEETAAPRRQQTAPLPAMAPKHEGKYEYADFEGQSVFVKGEGDASDIDANDALQGSLGDCYFIAAMAAVARATPDAIRKLIVDNGDGTYDVTLHIRETRAQPPAPKTVTIDTRFPEKHKGTPLYAKLSDDEGGKDGRGSESELWGALLEKALAQEKGSYEDIRGSKISNNGFAYAGALEMLTGKGQKTYLTGSLTAEQAFELIHGALESGKPVMAGTHNMKNDQALADEARAHNVVGNHAYAPAAVDRSGKTIDLTNPWGAAHAVEGLSADKFMKYYKNIKIG